MFRFPLAQTIVFELRSQTQTLTRYSKRTFVISSEQVKLAFHMLHAGIYHQQLLNSLSSTAQHKILSSTFAHLFQHTFKTKHIGISPLHDWSMRMPGAITDRCRVQAGVNSTFELRFGMWFENCVSEYMQNDVRTVCSSCFAFINTTLNRVLDFSLFYCCAVEISQSRSWNFQAETTLGLLNEKASVHIKSTKLHQHVHAVIFLFDVKTT